MCAECVVDGSLISQSHESSDGLTLEILAIWCVHQGKITALTCIE